MVLRIPAHLESQYFAARNVQQRLIFYDEYFEIVLRGVSACAMPDLSDVNRKEIQMVTWGAGKVLMSGFVHRPSDNEAEEVAADEAYTRVGQNEYWDTFRFFLASETISFFKGNMQSGDWVLQATFHPIYDAQRIRDFVSEKLMSLPREDR